MTSVNVEWSRETIIRGYTEAETEARYTDTPENMSMSIMDRVDIATGTTIMDRT